LIDARANSAECVEIKKFFSPEENPCGRHIVERRGLGGYDRSDFWRIDE